MQVKIGAQGKIQNKITPPPIGAHFVIFFVDTDTKKN